MIDKIKREFKAHTIILPSYCPVAICATKKIAEDLARSQGYENYRIVLTTQEHIEWVMGK